MKNIFKLKRDEIEVIMRIWYKETLIAHGFINVGYWDRVEDIVRKEYLGIADTYVYKIEEKIVGFISVLEDEFVGALFVDEKYQGQGIGTSLLDFVKKNKDRVILRAYKKNEKAIKFYEKNDFVAINEKENLENGEREHIMIWRL